MSILIAGAGGQIGRELRIQAGTNAIAFDRKQLDITNREQVQETLQRSSPRVVINCAAYTAVDRAQQDTVNAYAINSNGAENLALACKSLNVPLLHLSTDYVFDGLKKEPYLETDIASPQGIYADSKWKGEQAVRGIHAAHIIMRVSWVFGVHGGNFVKTILKLANERPQLRIIADQHGCPTSAASIASALMQLARNIIDGKKPGWGTYHYTGTPATTWYGFAGAIVKQGLELGLINNAPVIVPITTAEYPLPAPRPSNSLLDCARAEKLLGLQRRDWQTELTDVLTELAKK